VPTHKRGGGGGVADCSLSKSKFKNTVYVDTISNVLHDLLFSRNSYSNQYIGILKNKMNFGSLR
jgi:hypothetical protein